MSNDPSALGDRDLRMGTARALFCTWLGQTLPGVRVRRRMPMAGWRQEPARSYWQGGGCTVMSKSFH